MGEPRTINKTTLAIGMLSAALGFYFVLVGAGLRPPPGESEAPSWIALCCGLTFLAAGAAVTVRGLLGVDDKASDLPPDAPASLKAIYGFAGVAAAAALALIGTWVAFGPGERHFTMGGPVAGPLGDGLGRTMFGLGAFVAWVLVALMARAGMKKIFGKKS